MADNDNLFVAIIGGGFTFHLVAWWVLHWFGADLNVLPQYCQLTPTIIGMIFGYWYQKRIDKKNEERDEV